MDIKTLLEYDSNLSVEMKRSWGKYLLNESYGLPEGMSYPHAVWVINNKYGYLKENESKEYIVHQSDNDQEESQSVLESKTTGDNRPGRTSSESTGTGESSISGDSGTKRKKKSTYKTSRPDS